VTHSSLQLGLALAGVLAGVGLTVLLGGLGLVWAGKEEKRPVVPGRGREADERELVTVG